MKKVLLVVTALGLLACTGPSDVNEFDHIKKSLEQKYSMSFDCYERLYDLKSSDGMIIETYACVGDDDIARLVYVINREVTL